MNCFRGGKKKYKKRKNCFRFNDLYLFPDYKSNICSLLKVWKKLPPKELGKKAKSPGSHPQLHVLWLKASEHPIPSSQAPVESVAHGGKLGPACSFWISSQKFVFNRVPRTGTRKGDCYPMSAQKALGSPDQRSSSSSPRR